jgi:hypothetical protein
MNARVITGIISFCLAVTGLFLANTLLTMMIGEINRTRQDGNLVSYFGFTFPKMLRIFGEYRSSYPTGHLHMYALAAFAVAMVALISVAVCLHIIG